MNPLRKKSAEMKGLQQFKKQAIPAHQFGPPVAHSKNAVPAPKVGQPMPPPVYKGQAKPNAVQQKVAGPAQMRTQPLPPPAYRPQLQPKVLQTKMTGEQSRTGQSPCPPVAPPVYRPQPQPQVLQRMNSQSRGSISGQANPQPSRHGSVQAGTIQRYEVKYSTIPYLLTGGSGVTAVKNVKGGHHVSITHKAANVKRDTVEITGFHFTYRGGSHIYWNRDEGGGRFSHSSAGGTAIPGNQAYITDKVFTETQKVATNCGCTISDQRVPAPAPVIVAAAAPAPLPAFPLGPFNDAW